MQIISTLNSICSACNLRYVVIGGHAVNVRGYGRTTRDLDLVCPADSREIWKKEIVALGYKLFHEQKAFMQFSIPEPGYWPLDVMLVSSETFEKLWDGADEMDMGGTIAKIAAVIHLIPMKLHALKSGPSERWPKDIADILELLRLESMDIDSSEFKQLCEKYANMDVYERISQFQKK